MKASMMRDADLFAHAFFEGSDDYDYYFGYVANKFIDSKSTEAYVCNGKDEVIVARDLIIQNRPDLMSIFFIDCDYDRYTNRDLSGVRTFITDYYSVESYLATPSHIEIIAKAKCLLDPSISEHRVAINEFWSRFSEFAERMRRLSATMIWLRQTGVVAHFGPLRLRKFGAVEESGEFVAEDKQVEELLKAVGQSEVLLDVPAIDAIESLIAKENPLNWIRGKFVLEYVAAYFHRRVEAIRAAKAKRSDGRHVRVHPATSPNQISLCGEVGGTAPMAPSLAAFLGAL